MQELSPFAHFLKERRHALDLTQRELAERVGCTLSTIAKLENAERRPSKQLVELLAVALQLPRPDAARLAALARLRPQAVSSVARPTTPSGGPMVASTTPASRPMLVGRYHEWSALKQIWEQTASRGAHMVVLVGSPGIGKTRLADELLVSLRRQHYPTAFAQAFPVDATLAYRPALRWLRSDDIRAALPRLDYVWRTEIARLLPEVLDGQGDQAVPGPLNEPWQRSRLFEALAHAVLGDRSPRLFVLDDLHWCDHETLDWLSYLLHFDPSAPLLVVATLRREEVALDHPVAGLLLELARGGLVTRIPLDPLDAEAVTLLASQVVGRALTPALAEQIYLESEGNPLFIIEMARAVTEDSTPGDGVAAVNASATLAVNASVPVRQVPPAVQSLMLARLAQLPGPMRDLVEFSATYGQEVTYQLLRAVGGQSATDLARLLDQLCAQGILREVGEARYDFTHHKLRDVAYAQMSAARRYALHESVARALEAMHADELDHASAQIAVHYERARQPERALRYYQRAAHASRQIFANAEAMTLLRRALALTAEVSLGSNELRAEVVWKLQEDLGDLLELGGQHAEALAVYQEALTHLPVDDTLNRSRLNRNCAKVWEVWRHYAEAAEAYSTAEAALGAAPEERETEWWHAWLEIQLNRMWLHFWQGDWAVILSVAERAKPFVMRLGTSLQRARFFHGLALAAYCRDRFAASSESLAYCRAHLASSQETTDPRQIGFAHYVLGYDLMLRGDLEDAERELRLSLQIANHVGDIVLQARCLAYLGRLSRQRHDVEEATSRAEQCLRVAEAGGMWEYVAMGRAVLAWAAWGQGDAAGARTHAQAAVQLWRNLPIVYPFQWAALLPLMGVSLKSKQHAIAVDYARAMLDPAQQRLPEQLAVALQAAIRAWDAAREDREDEVAMHLTRALAAAADARYL